MELLKPERFDWAEEMMEEEEAEAELRIGTEMSHPARKPILPVLSSIDENTHLEFLEFGPKNIVSAQIHEIRSATTITLPENKIKTDCKKGTKSFNEGEHQEEFAGHFIISRQDGSTISDRALSKDESPDTNQDREHFAGLLARLEETSQKHSAKKRLKGLKSRPQQTNLQVLVAKMEDEYRSRAR